MVAAHPEGHAETVVEDIAHMTIDNNMRKRRAVHMAKSPADDLGGLGESLRRIPSTEGEQVAGAFCSRRTESSRERMSISSTPPQVVHSANSSSADGTPVQWGAASPPATPGFAGEEAASTAPALFDALPAELVCAVAAALCTAPGLVAMLRTCRTWRLAVSSQGAPLWRLVTLQRFPRVAAIMRVKPSDLSWPEIYRLQLLSLKPKPELRAEDFVLSFELRKGDRLLAEGSSPLLPPNIADEALQILSCAPLWDKETAPKVLRDNWESARGAPSSSPLFSHGPKVTLSVWVTRDMRTVQLCTQREREGRELIDSASYDHQGHHTRGYYEPEDLPRLAGPSDATTRLQPDFDEATGQVCLYCSVEEDDDEQSTTSIYLLDYLEALLPAHR